MYTAEKMCFLHFNKRADSARKNEEVLIIIQSLHLKMTIYGYCRQSKNYIGLKKVNKSINKKTFITVDPMLLQLPMGQNSLTQT